MAVAINVGLAKVFNAAEVQLVCRSQRNQFGAACDVTAIQPSVRDMPGIILDTMQSDRESLLPELRHSGIAFWNYWNDDTRAFYVHGYSFTD